MKYEAEQKLFVVESNENLLHNLLKNVSHFIKKCVTFA